MLIGATIADADKNDCNLLYDFGVNLGLAFQAQRRPVGHIQQYICIR